MQGKFHSGILSIVQQFQKVSPVPKLLCGLFLLFYFLGYIDGVEINLIVTPGFLAPPHAKLWTLITSVFYENNIVWVVLDVIAMVGFSLLLEPLWGLKEFLMFSSLVGSISMLNVALVCMMIYAVSGSITILFAHLHGFIGLVCGYLVAVKQAHPDSVAFPPPAPPTLRVMHLPLLVTIIALLFAILKLVSFTHSLLAFNGMLVSWIYLRFYQRGENGIKGDVAETFAFATFFPEFMHPVVSVMGDNVFRVLVKLNLCRKAVTYDVGAPSAIKISLPGTTPIDAERRKQKALKALDERLSKTTHSTQIDWPSLEDNTSSDEQTSLPLPKVSTSSSSPLSQTQNGSDITVPESVVIENKTNPVNDKT